MEVRRVFFCDVGLFEIRETEDAEIKTHLEENRRYNFGNLQRYKREMYTAKWSTVCSFGPFSLNKTVINFQYVNVRIVFRCNFNSNWIFYDILCDSWTNSHVQLNNFRTASSSRLVAYAIVVLLSYTTTLNCSSNWMDTPRVGNIAAILHKILHPWEECIFSSRSANVKTTFEVKLTCKPNNNNVIWMRHYNIIAWM